MRWDHTDTNREQLRRALIAAGRAGLTPDDVPHLPNFKYLVLALRRRGMPIVTKRSGTAARGRFWVSVEMAGDAFTAKPRPCKPKKPPTPKQQTRLERIIAIVEQHPGGITRAAIKQVYAYSNYVEPELTVAVKAGRLFRCFTNESRVNTIYFRTAVRMAAYQALFVPKPPKVKGKPGRKKVDHKAPTAPQPLKLAPSKPKPPPIVRQVIVPEGLKPIALDGFKPRDLAAGADLYFRQALGVGHYMPSSSAIARAYGAQQRA